MKQEAIHTSEFKYEKRVVCGYCQVTGIDNNNNPCSKCIGIGMLLRVSEGTVKLFSIPKNSIITINK